MKKTLFLCTILLALGLTASPVLAAEAPVATVSAPVSLDFLNANTGSCATGTLATPALFAAADLFGTLSCCRPECFNNSGCDKKCGKGLGTCVQVNSCCKQCICSIP